VPDTRFIIITGLSGAGRTQALRALEDLGFFCVDNLPPALLPKFAELCTQPGAALTRLAMVCDIRSGELFGELFDSLIELERMGVSYQILFLEADDDTLVRRYKESRRRHPFSPDLPLLDAIQAERRLLEEVRGRAHIIIDTSDTTTQHFKEQMRDFFSGDSGPGLLVTIVSFGYKYGLPMDADLVFDVRFLPNPFYVEALKRLGGDSPEVYDYVTRGRATQQFMRLLYSMMQFLLPQFINEGKSQVRIAIGCTGGQHRSVVVSRELASWMENEKYKVILEHRDLQKAMAEVASR
jgi:RNase adapter protein RapZ